MPDAFDSVKRITTLSKEGRHQEALALARDAILTDADNAYVHEAFGWAIYRTIHAGVRESGEEPGGPGIRAGNAGPDVNGLLTQYCALTVKRPSLLHSFILLAAARAGKAGMFPKFCGFLRWWDPANLRAGDFDDLKDPAGAPIRMTSLARRVVSAIAATIGEESRAEVLACAAGFVREHRTRFEDPWIAYHAARAFLRVGDTERALVELRRFIPAHRNDAWAWQCLASCFGAGTTGRLACLCRGATCRVQGPEFLLTLRVELAAEFLAHGKPGFAAHEVGIITRIRNAHGWAVKGALSELMRDSRLADAAAQDSEAACGEYADQAPYVAGLLTASRAILSGRVDDRFFITDEDGRTHGLRFDKFREATGWRPGSFVEAHFAGRHDRAEVLQIRKLEECLPDTNGWRRYEGEYGRAGAAGFGFIKVASAVYGPSDIFVPPDMAADLPARAAVCGVAAASYDAKHDRPGWRAVTIDVRGDRSVARTTLSGERGEGSAGSRFEPGA